MKTLVMNYGQLSDVYKYFEETWIEGFGVELISQYEMFRTNNCSVIPQLIEDDFSFAPSSTATTATTPGHWTSFVIISQHDKAPSIDTYVPNSAQTIRLKIAMASPLPNRQDIAPRLRTPRHPRRRPAPRRRRPHRRALKMRVKASLSSSTPTSARRAKSPWSLITTDSLFN